MDHATPGGASLARDAVRAARDRWLERRQCPRLPPEFDTTVREVVSQLEEVRELAEPAATRGPRAESAYSENAAAVRNSREPQTALSDRAHFSWQLRRALLFHRRPRCQYFHKTSEQQLCDVLASASLVHGAVDVHFEASGTVNGSETWVDAIKDRLHPPLKKRTISRIVIGARRGLQFFPAACRDAHAETHAESTTPNAALRAPPPKLRAWLSAVRTEWIPASIDKSDFQAFAKGLPDSMRSPHVFAKVKLHMPRDVVSRRAPLSAADLGHAAALPSTARDICCLFVPLRFSGAGGVAVLVTNLLGRPLHMSNGVYQNSRDAVACVVCELKGNVNPAFAALRPGTAACHPELEVHETTLGNADPGLFVPIVDEASAAPLFARAIALRDQLECGLQLALLSFAEVKGGSPSTAIPWLRAVLRVIAVAMDKGHSPLE
uniref:Uncharacterized protein n=1 Tax=Neobodo designis TaxID=312471 RepID=A0A7S1PS78_NEODS